MTRFTYDFAGFVMGAAICALPACAVINSFAREAHRESRAGVIREGSAAGTRLVDLGAQDAQSRPGNRQPTPGESLAANEGSPGFASESPTPYRITRSARPVRDGGSVAPSYLPRVARSQGVRSVLPGLSQPVSFAERAPGGHLYEVTSYSHGCTLPRVGPERPPQRAANGRWPIADLTVAADTRIHPFGSEVLIEGLGFRFVHDRGAAIVGRRLDLFVDSCREARRFGRRWLKVFAVPRETTRASLGGVE